MALSSSEIEDLRTAKSLLENPGLAAKISDLVGVPIEKSFEFDVGRESPGSEDLRRAFRAEISRTQRRADGTISLAGRRFEIPSRYRHLERVRIRYVRWDLATCDLIAAHSGAILCALYPLDKAANATGLKPRRRAGLHSLSGSNTSVLPARSSAIASAASFAKAS